MDRWEYRIVVREKFFYEQHPYEDLENELNRLGIEGWEAVGYEHFERARNKQITVLLKRRHVE